jgi:hypothetical protein
MRARCRHCRASFEAQRISAVYCSNKCRLASWRKTRRAIARSEFYTPPEVVAAARTLLGAIDLDPASCAAANEVVRASRYYSFREDGLALPWHGRVWINPPFPWLPWVPKLLAEWRVVGISPASSPWRRPALPRPGISRRWWRPARRS